jgi:hypothetical protein
VHTGLQIYALSFALFTYPALLSDPHVSEQISPTTASSITKRQVLKHSYESEPAIKVLNGNVVGHETAHYPIELCKYVALFNISLFGHSS